MEAQGNGRDGAGPNVTPGLLHLPFCASRKSDALLLTMSKRWDKSSLARSVASRTMIRIETTQGTLARRGFVDAEAAARVIDHWDDEHEPLLDVLAQCADPDHALASLDRLGERVPGLLSRLIAEPLLARQLIMVLGASSKLTLHLLAHPEHIELLTTELIKVPAETLRRELLEATGADPNPPCPSRRTQLAISCGSPIGEPCCGSLPATCAHRSHSRPSPTSPTNFPTWRTPP